MKKIFKRVLPIILSMAAVFGLVSCSDSTVGGVEDILYPPSVTDEKEDKIENDPPVESDEGGEVNADTPVTDEEEIKNDAPVTGDEEEEIKNDVPVVDKGKAELLSSPAVSVTSETKKNYEELLPSLKSFAANFGGDYFSNSEEENAIISPVSVYMALALASECAAGDTEIELLSVLNTDKTVLEAAMPSLYSALNKSFIEHDGAESGKSILTNSVWYDSGIDSLNSSCLNQLSSYYGAYSYQADFANDNEAANNAVRHFINENTNGLIDRDWNLSEETLIALINTLYIKDVWGSWTGELSVYCDGDFLNGDGTTEKTTYYSGFYESGKAAEAEDCSYFFADTTNGFRLTFIKPNEGKSVNAVLTSSNIEKILSGDYEEENDEKKERYYTRCIFPEFTLETNTEIKENLKRMGVNSLFDADICDFSSISEQTMYCSGVQHAAKLSVNKSGVEGAAVTIEVMAGSTEPDVEYTEVCEDFILKRSFGLVVSYNGVPLFVGALNSL